MSWGRFLPSDSWTWGRRSRSSPILREATTSSAGSPVRPKLRPALVLGHFDTVWPRGTIEKMPFRVDDGRAFGPGVFDMKASLVVFLEVMEFLKEHTHVLERPVWVLFTSDEEIGSPTSRGLIEELAREAAYALVLEPALD